MPITLEQYREAPGESARGLPDGELRKRLDYTYRFAEAYYDWWKERKGTATDVIGGGYVYDRILEGERRSSPTYRHPPMFDKIKLENGETMYPYELPQPDPAFLAAIKEHIWKIPKGNLLQS